jgi:hypothetical protein
MTQYKFQKVLQCSNNIICLVSYTYKTGKYSHATDLVFLQDENIIKTIPIHDFCDCTVISNTICCISYYYISFKLNVTVINTTNWETVEFNLFDRTDDPTSVCMINENVLCIYPQILFLNIITSEIETNEVLQVDNVNELATKNYNNDQPFLVTPNTVEVNQSYWQNWYCYAELTDITTICKFFLNKRQHSLLLLEYKNYTLITVTTRLWWLLVKAIQLLTNHSELRIGQKHDLKLLISAAFIESSDCLTTGATLVVFSSRDLTVLISQFL